MLEFIVDDNKVLRKYDSVPERYKIPMHSQNAIEVLFELDETWKEHTITAQLTKLQSTYNLLLDANNKVLIPSDITEGLWHVSVFGVKGSATRNTTISACLNVVRGGYVTSGTPPVPPTPDLYQRLIYQFRTGEVTDEKIADKEVTLSKLGDDVLAKMDINEIARQLAPMMSIKPDGTFVINTTD